MCAKTPALKPRPALDDRPGAAVGQRLAAPPFLFLE
jgi:hypothetical protein